jgi:hypothetical protein
MKKYVLGACACLLVFSPINNTMAGFKFTAPVQQQTAPSAIPGGLLPTPPADIPMMPSVPQSNVITEPTQPITRSDIIFNSPATANETDANAINLQLVPTANSQSSDNDIAVGFGKDIPLTTALRQIIPADYSYVIDQNVSGEQFVSWNGGREWPLVMNDMIEPLGLKSSIDGRIVRLTNNQMQADTPALVSPRPEPSVAAPMSLIPETRNTTPTYSQPVMDLEEIEAKAVAALPTPPRDIIMQDFNMPKQSAVPQVTQGQWRAQNGDSLRTVIESWANIEGVDLFWSSEFDYKLAGDVNISGNFEQAIETLLSGFSEAQPRPTGRLHPNLPHGPAVLVVETRQSSS